MNTSPHPWKIETVQATQGPAAHVYLVDATGRKIGCFWGPMPERLANAEWVVQHDPSQRPMFERSKDMATPLALGIAAQMWCDPRNEDKVLDNELAEVFAERLDVYIEALRWCSASANFHEGGLAFEDWRKTCLPLIHL